MSRHLLGARLTPPPPQGKARDGNGEPSSLVRNRTRGTLLFAAPPAGANQSGTARYSYNVVGFEYDAAGDLTGGRASESCRANYSSGWLAHVGTAATPPDELQSLTFGDASLRIGNRGTTGLVKAALPVTSSLTDGFHVISTVCDNLGTPFEDEQKDVTTPCSAPATNSTLRAFVQIAGGVGNRVQLTWRFEHDNPSGFLVLNSFRCVEPVAFNEAPACVTKAKLNTFTRKTATLPFECLYSTSTPPAGTDYTAYSAISFGFGAITLKRTKKR